MNSAVTPGHDLAGYLRSYPVELTFGGEDPGAVFDRYHTPDFVLTNDGVALDRERLLAHVRPARKNAATVRVEVGQALVADGWVAARYTLTATMRRGHIIATDIYMFGQLAADGRLRCADQLTRTVSSPDGDV